jgi:hypothetical protein
MSRSYTPLPVGACMAVAEQLYLYLSRQILFDLKWQEKESFQGSLMMEAVRSSETSVDNHFTRQYIPEDNSEYHTRRHENLKSHRIFLITNK